MFRSRALPPQAERVQAVVGRDRRALYARVQFCFAQIARETAGAASTRSSLRPLFEETANETQTSDATRRENAKSYSVVIRSVVITRAGG
jgi:hypothetical protein